MVNDTTTITVSKANWRRLNSLKDPGESFDDVIQRLLSDADVCPCA